MEWRTTRQALTGAWPELAGDPALIAGYERALEGLDPGVLAAVIGSVRTSGRPLPSPAIMRTAVLARQATAHWPSTAAGPPDPPLAGGPPAQRRGGEASEDARPSSHLVLISLMGIGAFLGFSGTRLPWLIGPAPAHATFVGTDAAGGQFLGLIEVATFVAAIVAGVGFWRHGAGRRVRTAYAFTAALQCYVFWAAVSNFRDARGVLNRYEGFSIGQGLWQMLIGPAVAIVAAALGYVIARRGGDGFSWSGEAGRRWRRRWAIIGAALACAGALVAFAIARSGPSGADRAAEQTYQSRLGGLREQEMAAARSAYLRWESGLSSRTDQDQAALSSALGAGDASGLTAALTAQIQAEEAARDELLAPPISRPSTQRGLAPLTIALTRQIAARRAALDQIARGTPPASALAAIAAADGDLRPAMAQTRTSFEAGGG